MGGCLAGAVVVAAVLALAGAAGRVLGAGAGAGVGPTKDLTVFVMSVAAVVAADVTVVEPEVEETDLAVLPAGTSFASQEEDKGLLGGSRGCLGACSGPGSASELGWLPVEPSLFFDSSSGVRFLRLLSGSSSTRTGLEDLALPMGVVCPFFNAAWLSFPESSPSCSGSSNRTPRLTSSSLGFRIDIFRSKTSDVSLNLSLLFFFLHFHGLKILPNAENLLFLLVGGVVSPASTLSMPMPGSPEGCSASSDGSSMPLLTSVGREGVVSKSPLPPRVPQHFLPEILPGLWPPGSSQSLRQIGRAHV